MDPLVSDIYADVQSLVGEPPGGDVYTSTMLAPFFGMAYREIYNVMLNWSLEAAYRSSYGVLPAYSSQITPGQLGLNSFGEPQKMWERAATAIAITALTNTTPVQVTTATPHQMTSNARVNMYGLSDVTGINGVWFVTVIDATNFTLNNSVAGGVWTSGGSMAYSNERWVEMNPAMEQLPQATSIDGYLRYWLWQVNTFLFNGASADRELWIEHSISGDPPISGPVGIDNSRSFLAYRTASIAAMTRDEDRAAELKAAAFGPSGAADGSGGFLLDLLRPMLLQKHRTPRRRQAYRKRRHNVLIGSQFV